MGNKPNNTLFRILFAVVLGLMALGAVGIANAQSETPVPGEGNVYPLYDPMDGHQYPADNDDDRFDAEWAQDGRLWQPNLPDKAVLAAMEEAGELESFTVAFKLVKGDYMWSGVECTLKLDPQRVGDGGRVEYVGGNAKTFTVSPDPLEEGSSETLPVAWASATCNGNVSTGFEILATDYSSDAPAPADDATSEPEAEDRMSVEDEPNPAAPATTEPPAPTATLTFDEMIAKVCVRPGATSFYYDDGTYWCPNPTATPPAPEPEEVECAPFSATTGEALISQPGEACQYGTPTDDGEPIVPSYWSNRPWVALVLTLLAIVAAIMFGVWAYKAFKATPAQKTKAIIFAIIAVVAGVAAIPLAIWFF